MRQLFRAVRIICVVISGVFTNKINLCANKVLACVVQKCTNFYFFKKLGMTRFAIIFVCTFFLTYSLFKDNLLCKWFILYRVSFLKMLLFDRKEDIDIFFIIHPTLKFQINRYKSLL